MPQPHALRLARLYWASGDPIPLDVEVSLMQLGFCVRTLEARYSNS